MKKSSPQTSHLRVPISRKPTVFSRLLFFIATAFILCSSWFGILDQAARFNFPHLWHDASGERSAFEPVVAVLFLSVLDVNPAQFFEINLLIGPPAVAKNE